MKITQSFNSTTQRFIYKSPGLIPSEQFRETCFKEYKMKVFTINHLRTKKEDLTIGFSEVI